MFETGYWNVASWKGVPIRIHWSAALGAFAFGGFRLAPGAWIGFFVIVLLHELGHAWLVRRRRLRATAVHILAFGGECRYTGDVTAFDRAIIAWGGVLAQLVVLVVALVLMVLLPPLGSTFLADLLHAFTLANAILIGLNLLPFRPLDGHEAWKLPKLWRQARKRARRRAAEKRARRPEVKRQARDWSRETLEQLAGRERGEEHRSPEPDRERDPEQAPDPELERTAEEVARRALEHARRRDGDDDGQG